MSYLEIEGLSHSFGDKTIYRNAEFRLNKGEHVGVVGQNGAGKSTLIGICTGELLPDAGRVQWHPGLQMGHLDQYADLPQGLTVLDLLHSAFSDLYALEKEMTEQYTRYGETGDEKTFARAAQCQAELEAKDFYGVDTRVDKVANGLGLTAIGLSRELSQLSGGQRAKSILAKLLLEEPDVLLLDEPTNFLDKEHVKWLSEFLSACPQAFLVVSHDHQFLEDISTHICDVENGEIRKYAGKYSDFLRQKEHLREDYIRRYQTQQREIKKTEEFIRRNIAGVNTRMAQGRRKQLERLERLAPPSENHLAPQFRFEALPATSQDHLTLRALSIGYDFPLLPRLDFSLKGGQKVVVTGFNGIGKSTLLKTLVGELPALGGSFRFAEGTSLGYYSQDLVWNVPERTPLEIFRDAYPRASQKEARQKLFRCAISKEHAMQPIGTLSGGEQAKLKLCLLMQCSWDFLILDEPTNHLDAAAKESLKTALSGFPGTVLLVSHEEDFYRSWAQRVVDLAKM